MGKARKVDRSLEELMRLELVDEVRRAPELEYMFKHALVQEVTYESILDTARKRLHRLVGQCVEELFAERLEEFYGLLAYHFTRADEWEKAQLYLVKAGDQAGKLAGNAEALAHYQQAFDAYDRAFGDRWEPAARAVLERRMAEVAFRRGERELAIEYLQRALESLGQRRMRRRGGGFSWRRVATPWCSFRTGCGWGCGLGTRREKGMSRHGSVAGIYEVFAWIDFFRDQHRVFLDALLMLNTAERVGMSVGWTQGLFGVGVACDLATLRRIAGY